MSKAKIALRISVLLALCSLTGVIAIHYFSVITKPNTRFSSEVTRQYTTEEGSTVPSNDNLDLDLNNQASYFTSDEPENTTSISSTWKIPLKSGTRFDVIQGYFGNFSHKGKYALDLHVHYPAQVVAARLGKIVELGNGGKWDQWCSSWENCYDKGSVWKGNHIIIEHKDGTRAKYFHLQSGSIPNLKVGDQIKQGDILGSVGETGYTCDDANCTKAQPQLHFEVTAKFSTITIPTAFSDCNDKTNQCDKSGYLIEGKFYTSN